MFYYLRLGPPVLPFAKGRLLVGRCLSGGLYLYHYFHPQQLLPPPPQNHIQPKKNTLTFTATTTTQFLSMLLRQASQELPKQYSPLTWVPPIPTHPDQLQGKAQARAGGTTGISTPSTTPALPASGITVPTIISSLGAGSSRHSGGGTTFTTTACTAPPTGIGCSLEDEGDDKKQKRKRTSPEQLQVLEAAFNSQPHPSLSARCELAARLSMTPRSVQIWFQNR